MNRLWIIACLAALLAARATAAELWLYAAENLAVNERVARLETLFDRAHAAGYTHVLLYDSKFCRLTDLHDGYFKNVARVRAAAARDQLTIVPAVYPVGYSNDLLWQDPDLAEGPPIRDARFVVHGGIARPESEAPPRLRGGDFSDLKSWDWKDETVSADNGTARMSDPKGGNARIVQKLRLLPWRQYHLGVRVKTDAFKGVPEVKILAGPEGRALNFATLGVAPTQDWTTHHVVFNSLTYTNANLYLGFWGSRGGTVWWDDATLEETALVNLVRRPGAPFRVRTATRRELREGDDYEPVHDPRMGHVKWPGDYDVWHEPPAIRMRGQWPDGTELRVDATQMTGVHEEQVMLDLAEPKADLLLREQARGVQRLFGGTNFMLSHDEIRVLGWSDAAKRSGKTPGQLVGDSARSGFDFLRSLEPAARVFAWSDMFDPNHNAVRGPYYMVDGSLEGSWERLPKDLVIVNWNHGKRDASLRFFAGRGHRQLIAGYYDNPWKELDEWIASSRGTEGVVGFMYTTWRGDYSNLEEFARRVKESTR